jgi:hypothetical protein
VTLHNRWAEESTLMWAGLDFEALQKSSCGLAAHEWTDQLIANAGDGPLPDSPAQRGTPHLWGRTQELVVARVASLRGDQRGLDRARQSCHDFLKPLAADGFRSRETTLPYEVSSVFRCLRTVATITFDAELAAAAERAVAWFWGFNRVGRPIFDPLTGRASDGLDGSVLSRNSGAESNIEALFCALNPPTSDLILDQSLMR